MNSDVFAETEKIQYVLLSIRVVSLVWHDHVINEAT